MTELSTIEKANVQEVVQLLKRTEADWEYLSGEERHGSVHEARTRLEDLVHD